MSFTIKKARKPGFCAAVRCKEGAVDLLCAKHEAEWKANGSQALAVATPEAPKGPALALSEEEQAELTAERATAAKLLTAVQTMPLKTQEQTELAGAIRERCRVRIGLLEKQRVAVTGPLNQALKAMNGTIKPNQEFFEKVINTIDGRLQKAHLDRQAKQLAAMAVVEAQGGVADMETLLVAHDTPELPDTVKVQDTFEYRITDFAALPDEFKIHNHMKIQALVSAQGLDTKIPGVAVQAGAKIAANRGRA